MIKAKVIKSHPKYGYFEGETGYFDDKKAEELAKEGYIEPLGGYFPGKKEKD